MKKVKFREWQKAKASPEEEVKLKEYVEARKEAKKAVTKGPWPSGYELRLSLGRSRVLILVKVIGG